MAWAGALASWLPALLALVLSILAVRGVAASPDDPARKRRMITRIAVVGALAIAAALWQARRAANEVARLIDENRTAALTEQVAALQAQLSTLKLDTVRRTISPDTATKLADYLRPFGAHRVVVSCIPNDIEAYHYATAIVGVLKDAKWDARGPETTKIFGDITAMGVNVYASGGSGHATTKILLDGFAKFGIPYQSRVPPSEALPENETIELFIGTKPGRPASPGTAP